MRAPSMSANPRGAGSSTGASTIGASTACRPASSVPPEINCQPIKPASTTPAAALTATGQFFARSAMTSPSLFPGRQPPLGPRRYPLCGVALHFLWRKLSPSAKAAKPPLPRKIVANPGSPPLRPDAEEIRSTKIMQIGKFEYFLCKSSSARWRQPGTHRKIPSKYKAVSLSAQTACFLRMTGVSAGRPPAGETGGAPRATRPGALPTGGTWRDE